MIFSPWNYKVLALGLLLVIIGFSAMYIENKVQGIISLYISPIVIMAGYVAVIVAILKHDSGSSTASDQSR
ncbi:DUF3098 domain-containing protein [Fodinibius sediminis]|nr:DUF3098 domain-containing protein [Fodinibius sediminis]